jgi:ribosome recycling factor
MAVKDEVKNRMNAAKEHLVAELKNIRTGRAHSGLLENVQVEVYGSPTRLRDVANITVPEPRQLLITPYDRGSVGSIAKSLEAANLGMRPIADATSIRLNLPEMSQEQRKQMAKVVKEKQEDAKVSIRNIRREFNDKLKKMKTDGEIAEDIQKKGEKDIQELTDKYCKDVDDLAHTKEKEVMEI